MMLLTYQSFLVFEICFTNQVTKKNCDFASFRYLRILEKIPKVDLTRLWNVCTLQRFGFVIIFILL